MFQHKINLPGRRTLCLALLLTASSMSVLGQNVDERFLMRVYEADNETLDATLRFADASSIPLFVLGPVTAVLGAGLSSSYKVSDAWLLGLSEVTAAGIMLALKEVIHRDRPYVSIEGIEFRRGEQSHSGRGSFSMPSGHATLAFSLATSVSLAFPRWYVIVPAYAWATTVGVSRTYFGMHYPSDIAAGAVLGAGVSLLVHTIGSRITPKFLRDDLKLGLSSNTISLRFTF